MIKLKGLLIVLVGIMVLILGLAIAGCMPGCPFRRVEQGEVPGAQIAPQVGKPAPDFTLLSLDGQDVRLSDFQGKPVLLTFWASWCPPCRAQKSHLITAYNDFADQGLVILGINVGEEPSLVREYVAQKGIPFPVLLGTEEVAHLYQVRGIPATFLIDRQGILREVRIGAFRSAADVATSVRKIIQPYKDR
jgi:peroxiredoxin